MSFFSFRPRSIRSEYSGAGSGSDAGSRGSLERCLELGTAASRCVGDFRVGGSGVAGRGLEGHGAGSCSYAGWLNAAATRHPGGVSGPAVASALSPL